MIKNKKEPVHISQILPQILRKIRRRKVRADRRCHGDKSPSVDARPLPAWGFHARNVQNLQFDNVRLRFEKEDLRPVLICTGVDRLTLEDFKFPLLPETPEAMVLNDTLYVRLNNADFPTVNPRCTELKLLAGETIGRIIAGKPYRANVTVENGKQEGLAKIELAVAGQKKKIGRASCRERV